jgi:hypothetical protein
VTSTARSPIGWADDEAQVSAWLSDAIRDGELSFDEAAVFAEQMFDEYRACGEEAFDEWRESRPPFETLAACEGRRGFLFDELEGGPTAAGPLSRDDANFSLELDDLACYGEALLPWSRAEWEGAYSGRTLDAVDRLMRREPLLDRDRAAIGLIWELHDRAPEVVARVRQLGVTPENLAAVNAALSPSRRRAAVNGSPWRAHTVRRRGEVQWSRGGGRRGRRSTRRALTRAGPDDDGPGEPEPPPEPRYQRVAATPVVALCGWDHAPIAGVRIRRYGRRA